MERRGDARSQADRPMMATGTDAHGGGARQISHTDAERVGEHRGQANPTQADGAPAKLLVAAGAVRQRAGRDAVDRRAPARGRTRWRHRRPSAADAAEPYRRHAVRGGLAGQRPVVVARTLASGRDAGRPTGFLGRAIGFPGRSIRFLGGPDTGAAPGRALNQAARPSPVLHRRHIAGGASRLALRCCSLRTQRGDSVHVQCPGTAGRRPAL